MKLKRRRAQQFLRTRLIDRGSCLVLVASAGGIIFLRGGPGPARWRMPPKGERLSASSFVCLVLGNPTQSDRSDLSGCPQL
jgi:hypothetical protein